MDEEDAMEFRSKIQNLDSSNNPNHIKKVGKNPARGRNILKILFYSKVVGGGGIIVNSVDESVSNCNKASKLKQSLHLDIKLDVYSRMESSSK